MMDFQFDSEQEELFERTRAFASAELGAKCAERLREGRFGQEEWQRAASFGIAGLCIPQAYGGMGLSALGTARLLEALGEGAEDRGLLFSLAAHLLACAVPIWKFGSDELKSSVLEKLSSGEWIGANAITESEAGSDVFSLKSTARRDGSDYVLDGAKSWVTNGPVADVFLVYAQTNPKFGYLGLSAFVVERDRPGLSLGKSIDKVGLQTSPTCSIYLESCRIPERNRVGAEGQGGPMFESAMLWERSCLFGLYVGQMQRQLLACVNHARERKQFGSALGSFQAVSHKIAEMKVRLEAARLLLYRACARIDSGKDARIDVAMAKLAVSEAAVQSGLDAVQLFGGGGVTTEMGVDRYLRDALPATIVSGTSEIQKNLIAKGLGL
jgi:alkylation response protein AidB-like acyl-CoA dehydrogenase